MISKMEANFFQKYFHQFSENLMNLFLFETSKVKIITDKEVLYQRIENKKKINNFGIDFSPEIMFIIYFNYF